LIFLYNFPNHLIPLVSYSLSLGALMSPYISFEIEKQAKGANYVDLARPISVSWSTPPPPPPPKKKKDEIWLFLQISIM
jgi:hypothetical protein